MKHCLLVSLFFFPQNCVIQVAYFPVLVQQNRPQNSEIETFPLHAQSQLASIGLAHKGIPQLVATCTVYYILYCTLYNSVHALKLTLQTSLLLPFKWENVPIISA